MAKSLKQQQIKALRNITTLIFDLDNTLIPTRKGDSKTCLKLAEFLHEEHGLEKTVAAEATSTYLRKFRRCPDNPSVPLDEWRMLLWSESLPEPFKYLTKTVYEYWLELRYSYLKLTPDLISLLRGLRQRYLMALVTNGESNAQWEKVNLLNIEKYFDCVLVSGDLPWEKPSPNIFHAACNYLGVPPAQSVMVGDKLETDIKGGRDANLGATIWVPLVQNGERVVTGNADIEATITITNVMELQELFLSNTDDDQQSQKMRTYRSGSAGHGKLINKNMNSKKIGFSLPDLDSCSSNSSSDCN